MINEGFQLFWHQFFHFWEYHFSFAIVLGLLVREAY